MQDHFTSPVLDTENWVFYNMTTPCYMKPERRGDSLLYLPEADQWNEGNCLLSRRFLTPKSRVEAVYQGWDAACSGAAAGFYGGDGSFFDYVLLAATSDRLEIRVHSGCQNGAAFMDKGQPKWYVVASCAYEKQFPLHMGLTRDGTAYTAYLSSQPVLSAQVPILQGDARALFKALPWWDRLSPCYAYLDWALADGFAPEASLNGYVTNEQGAPIPNASVHIAGFDNFFTLADGEGHFTLKRVPRGKHVLVAAAEGYVFTSVAVTCLPDQDNICTIVLPSESPETLPRREYNNPSFDRSMNGYACLNGTWQFAFDPENAGIAKQWYLPEAPVYGKAIRVPFSCASLMGFGEEHLVSGDKLHQSNTVFNNYHLTGQHLWYRRSFTVPDTFPDGASVILHIGASANVTYVWLDGRYIDMRWDEYSDLAFDLGPLAPGTRHTLAVKVQYPHDIPSHSMGKQIFWFASCPGIWQSVWIEPRYSAHLTRLHVRPRLIFEGDRLISAAFDWEARGENTAGLILDLTFTDPHGQPAASLSVPMSDAGARGSESIPQPILWQYREGRLYTVTAKLMQGETVMDTVKTYAGLRSVETRWLPGHSPAQTDNPLDQYQYVYLNNKPFYVIGILDQCYNGFGIYTYRSLLAEGEQGPRGSIAYDIDRTMAYGYNLSRVHIKENEPLWYHECDKQGLLVWTEHPSNFYASPEDPNWRTAYHRELTGMLERLYNHPSIVMVSTINESWGIEAGHGLSPWKNELRSRFMEEAATIAKERWPHVLVCDNSGFGKTNACEINDFHHYPAEYESAKQVWQKLLDACYPGSMHNYINAIHGPCHTGNAVQTGRPILISEFLHINGIDMQLRMFEKVAGYLRMNIASYETEDSAPLTAERYQRDYGYVDRDMQHIGYDMVNSIDMVVLDHNRLQQVHAGQVFACDVYTAHFSWKEYKQPTLHWSLSGIDSLGRYIPNLEAGEWPIAFAQFQVEKQPFIRLTIPAHIKGAYLFAWVEDEGTTICRNYIQLEVHSTADPDSGTILGSFSPAAYTRKVVSGFSEAYVQNDRSLIWACGQGDIEYAVHLKETASQASLVFEAGAREGINAVKVTDEIRRGTNIAVYWDGLSLGVASPSDDPSDERALFTNSALGGEPFNYMNLGRFGYGERFELNACTGNAYGSFYLWGRRFDTVWQPHGPLWI